MTECKQCNDNVDELYIENGLCPVCKEQNDLEDIGDPKLK